VDEPARQTAIDGRIVKLGLTILPDRDARECAEIGAAAERCGFDDVWLPDHYFLREAYAALALIAARTERVRLGTAVVSAVLRHPALLASAAATIDEISDGRAVVGIGPGGHEFAGQLGLPIKRPLSVTKEAVQIVRELLRGETTFAGREFVLTSARLGWPTREVPIYIAARGPRMLELAGAVADGVITHGLAPTHVEYVRERVRAGAEQVGRDPAACEICLMFDADIDEDVERAVGRLAPRSVVVAGGSYSEEMLPIYGLDPDQVAPLRAAVRDGDMESAASLVTPEIVNAFFFAGNAQQFAQRIEEFANGGVERIIVDAGSSGTLDAAVGRVEQLGAVVAAAGGGV
jgi:5,10-methylenetetrahydromethanopterin reductase